MPYAHAMLVADGKANAMDTSLVVIVLVGREIGRAHV